MLRLYVDQIARLFPDASKAELRRLGQPVGLATVYRQMEKLEAAG